MVPILLQTGRPHRDIPPASPPVSPERVTALPGAGHPNQAASLTATEVNYRKLIPKLEPGLEKQMAGEVTGNPAGLAAP